MSQDNLEVVRQPVAVRSHSRRRLDERLMVRFPGAVPLLIRVVWRLPPGSRLRQGLVRRYTQLGLEAANRGDYDAAFALFHSGVEANFDREFVRLGLDPVYRGREARLGAERTWTAEWSDFRYEPKELIDLGDGRLLVLGRMKGLGLRSGAAFDHDWAVLFTVSAGRVVREQNFSDRGRGLEAVGLRE
jgi:ketosteroid isomerase-like protein